MAASASHLTVNPFKSIMTMLYNNKCWLCEGVFARGKVKKVFMVSHLLRFLKEHHSQSRVEALQSKHLRECFDEYCRLEGNQEQVLKRLAEIECESWMSGLICCRTKICAEEYLLLVPEGKVVVPTTEAPKKSSEDCPPGCDCDNPWQFISAVLDSTTKSSTTTEVFAETTQTQQIDKETITSGTVLSKIFATKDEEFTFSFGLSDEGLAELAKQEAKTGTPSDTQPGAKSKKKKKKNNNGDARVSLSEAAISEVALTKKETASRHTEPVSKPQEHKKSDKKVEKKIGKTIVSTLDDNEEWFDPQPQLPTMPSKSTKSSTGPYIRSAKNLSLDAEAQQKLKFGDGKNLVAIAPPKVRNQLWISNPFAMGSFSFSFNVDPNKKD